MYTPDVGPVILMSEAISIEDFLSPQIAIVSGSDKYLLFYPLTVTEFIVNFKMFL